MGLKRRERNAYMRAYNKRFRLKHGVSVASKWRHDHPEEARKHREREKARWHREPKVRARHKAKGATYRRALKHEALVAYGGCLGPICRCCREADERFLTLDHRDNDGAKHRRQIAKQGFAGTAFYSWLRARGFPKRPRLQVNCYNCNCGKRANSGRCPHKDKQ